MFWSVTLSLLEGLREVVKLFALTLVFSLPLGLAVTFGSMSKCRPVSWFFNVLVWIVRGTPLMLQLILIFYGPGIWLGHNIWGQPADAGVYRGLRAELRLLLLRHLPGRH